MPVRTVVVVATAALLLPTTMIPASAADDPAVPERRSPTAVLSNPPSQHAISKWNLDKKELRHIAKAKTWSEKQKAVDSRVCRSGSNFRLTTGIGSGAYQINSSRWRRYGGKDFASRASRAPGFAQKLIAWRLFKDSSWKHLSCPTQDWMQVAFHKARGTTLAEMLIPGTHDSGANKIRDKAPCRPEVIAGAGPVFQTAAERNPCVAAALARAQSQGLGAQLRGGVRYLDLRVGVPASKVITSPRPPAKNPLSVPLVLQHNYVSQPLKKGLNQILEFAADHPKEQVVLDFQHVDLTDDQQIDEYYRGALDGFLHKLRPGSGARTTCESAWTKGAMGVKAKKIADKVSIGTAWKTGRNLLVLMDPAMPSSHCYYDRDDVISSPWPNTDVPSASKRANDGYLAEREDRLANGRCVDAEGINWCGLFVDQLQLTPSASVYANCVFNDVGDLCSLADLAGLVNDEVARYMRTWTNEGQPTNIQIVDFYQDSDPGIVDKLIRLNWKRTGQFPR